MKLGVALIASLALLSASAAEATSYTPTAPIARYCSTSGDLCFGIFRAGGIVFRITTVERYFARYRVCVRTPHGSSTCRTAPIRRQGPVYGSSVRWPRGFGDHGPGVYRVTWSQAGHRLGPTLRFRRR
jgi:hypothetical protein